MLNSEQIDLLVKKYDLILLVLFGSRASRQNIDSSDADFGYIAKKRLTFYQMEDLIYDLLRETKLEHVDVVDMYIEKDKSNIQAQKEILLKEILFNNIILYDDSNGGYIKNIEEILNFDLEDWNTRRIKFVVRFKIRQIENQFNAIKDLQNFPASIDPNVISFYKQNVVLKVISQIQGLNRFVLKCLKIPISNKVNNVYLIKNKIDLSNIIDLPIYKKLSKIMIFDSAENMDYKYGSGWSIDHLFQLFKEVVPIYLKNIQVVVSRYESNT